MSKSEPNDRLVVTQPDGGVIGPLGLDTIKDLILAGQVGPDAMVGKTKDQVIPIWSVPELAPLVGRHKPAKFANATYTGYFSELSFYKVFFRLVVAKETGRLLISRDELRKEIFLVNGQPVFVGSNLPEERIGEYLVHHGIIDRSQLEDALVICGNFGNQLGKTLMTMKVISPHVFYEQLVKQLRDKIEAVCSWIDGRYDFFKGVMYDGPRVPVELDPLEILTQAMRRQLTPSFVTARFGADLQKPLIQASTAPGAKMSQLPLTAFELGVYDGMGKMRTPEDLSREHAGRDGGKTALALCYFLRELGFVHTIK